MLENTSFAIHPGNAAGEEKLTFKDIGNVQYTFKDEEKVVFTCEGGSVAVRFYSAKVVRVTYSRENAADTLATPAVIREPSGGAYTYTEDKDGWEIKSSEVTVSGSFSPFRLHAEVTGGEAFLTEGERGLGWNSRGHLISFKEADSADHYYGFGEKTGFLDKKGETFTMWNTDVYAPHNPETDPLYQSIPFFTALRNGRAFGIFLDNPGKTHFNMKTEEGTFFFHTEKGSLDYYICAGPTMKDTVSQYTWLTGRMPLPPKWSLGYHQSRYSYENEADVMEVVETLEQKGIPLDAIYLDIHYMDGFRVFTFDDDCFPDPEKLVGALREKGVNVIPIVDPGVKEDPEYYVYKEGMKEDLFCKYIDGTVYHGDVWPGNSAFPDFTNKDVREWWGDKHRFYAEKGIEGIWNDMNEPAVFNETKTMDTKVVHDGDGHEQTHEAVHNLYGFLMGKATYEGMSRSLEGRRTFLLTRAGYAGIQRYAAVWTGDNRSFWEHLQLAVPMCMNLGISGVALCGPDVGGFAHDTNGELLARWTQFGVFTPFFRNHSSIDTIRQEPWEFGENTEEVVKKYIQLRYVWMPEIYKWFYEAHETGLPVMRPLIMEYPEDPETQNLYDQFMIGENTIVAPVMTPSTEHRIVYLPAGNWVDYWTDDVYEGGKHHLVDAPFDVIPVFVKQGAAVAQGSVKANTKVRETDWQLHVYLDGDGEIRYFAYDDDGVSTGYEQGVFEKCRFTVSVEGETVKVNTATEGSYKSGGETWSLVIHSGRHFSKAIYNGSDVSDAISNEKGQTVVKMKK